MIKGFLKHRKDREEETLNDVEILCMFQEIVSDKRRFKRAIKESKNQLKDLNYRAVLLSNTITLKVNSNDKNQ